MILLSLEKLMHTCEFEGEKKYLFWKKIGEEKLRILFLVEIYIVEQQFVIRIMYLI